LLERGSGAAACRTCISLGGGSTAEVAGGSDLQELSGIWELGQGNGIWHMKIFSVLLVTMTYGDHLYSRVCGFAGAGLALPYPPPPDPVGMIFNR
jgi:hypothetical protein